MRVAIVGAGYAGLAVAWHFLACGHEVTLFDGGPGASHASTGLLHPAPGKQAKPSLYAKEGMQAALELLRVASREKAVFEQNGLWRHIGSEKFWVPDAITVYSRLYLQELKKVCSSAEIVDKWVENLEALKEYDAIVLTTGAETLTWAGLPLKRTIGQSLVCRWKERLPWSLLGEGHITPTEDPELCQVGSTYEHTAEPDLQKAHELLEKVAHFYPPAKEFEIVEIRSGVRSSPKVGYQPLIKQIDPKTWVFTGLGSRGLLYHALFAKNLVNQMNLSK